jgi:acyl-coenzyme A synthetase/AMP-(fatty) acid ligase
VIFLDELPHTATGKAMKTTLREQFAHHVFPTAQTEGAALTS